MRVSALLASISAIRSARFLPATVLATLERLILALAVAFGALGAVLPPVPPLPLELAACWLAAPPLGFSLDELDLLLVLGLVLVAAAVESEHGEVRFCRQCAPRTLHRLETLTRG